MRIDRLAAHGAARWAGAFSALMGAALAATSSCADVETLHYVSDPYSQVGSFGVSSLPPFTLGATIAGSITLASPLAPNMVDQTVSATAFDLGDGTLDENSTTAGYTDFEFSTDAAANITGWFVLVNTQAPLGLDFISSSFRIAFLDDGNPINAYDNAAQYVCTDPLTCAPNADRTARTLEHGTFTTSFAASAPEPASWAMLISGAGLVGWAARRGRGRPGTASRSLVVTG